VIHHEEIVLDVDLPAPDVGLVGLRDPSAEHARKCGVVGTRIDLLGQPINVLEDEGRYDVPGFERIG